MASSIAAVFLSGGASVVLLGRATHKTALALGDVLRDAGAIDTQLAIGEMQSRLRAGDLWTWNEWDDVDLVIESVVEHLEIKRKIFAEFDRRVPACIPIGSNSSGFGISELTAGLATARRMLNLHFLMPANFVPLVEIALGIATDRNIGQQVRDLMCRFGKKPILIERDIPGLIASRLQHALMREALALIDTNIVTPDEIDDAVRFGFGFRYAAVGPMMQKEMSGWDTHLSSATTVYPSLATNVTPGKWLTEMVEDGRTGLSSGAGYKVWTAQTAQSIKGIFDKRLKAALAVLRVAPDI